MKIYYLIFQFANCPIGLSVICTHIGVKINTKHPLDCIISNCAIYDSREKVILLGIYSYNSYMFQG